MECLKLNRMQLIQENSPSELRRELKIDDSKGQISDIP